MYAIIVDTGASKFITRVYLNESDAIEFYDRHNQNMLSYKYTYYKIPNDLWFTFESEVMKGIQS